MMKPLKRLIASVLVIIAAFSSASAKPTDDGVWVTKEVREPLVGSMTVDAVKKLARDKARDLAIEEAVGSFVKGSTVVHNYQIADDIVHSLRRGMVLEEQVIKEGITPPDEGSNHLPVYNLTLKVKVKPMPVEKRKGLNVKLSLDRAMYKQGEDVIISVKTTMDAYIYVFDVFGSDTVTLLVPNKHLSDNMVKANTEFVFPGTGLGASGIRLRAQLPPGAKSSTERVKVIASTERIEAFDDAIKEAVFREYDGKNSAMIMDVHKALGMQDPATWAEDTAVYEIRK